MAALPIMATVVAVVSYFESADFEARARNYIVQEIERRTGATVTLDNFHWSFWQRRIWLEGLTLHGLEPAGEASLGYVRRIDIGLHFRSLLQRRVDLFELRISHPEFHIVITPDGKTNFPIPKPTSANAPSDFTVSIQNFNVVDGAAILNE